MGLACGVASEAEAALRVREFLAQEQVFSAVRREGEPDQQATWRVAPRPFALPAELVDVLEALGPALWRFQAAADDLYHLALREERYGYVADYLDTGKSEEVRMYGRMHRVRRELPVMLRPDLIWTADGLKATEIDAVPGGFGILAALQEVYADLGFAVIGGSRGILDAWYRAMAVLAGVPEGASVHVGIVVSDEADDYRPEMAYLARRLQAEGRPVECLHPREVRFEEEGLRTEQGYLQVLYRFFELFDLRNIPKVDLFLYAMRKGRVRMTPPVKAYLEEKIWFAFLHDPFLEEYWRERLGEDWELLRRVIPRSWVVDPRPVPPHALIPGLRVGNRPVRDWRQLEGATKSQREFVLKPSGYSPKAWGSRGVRVGPDLPQAAWQEAVREALAEFPQGPWVLQEYFKGVKVQTRYLRGRDEVVPMDGRVRLCPYYLVHGDRVSLAGVLATICPLDKKVIHGMVDAVMVPAARGRGQEDEAGT